MKKLLLPLVVAIVSLVITFFIFEIMSWYDFGGPITSIVLIRLIICFIIIDTSKKKTIIFQQVRRYKQ